MRKNFDENKKSLRRNVEKLKSRDNSPLPARYQSKHKRYLYLFVCLGVLISAIKLPRIPTYLLKNVFAYITKSLKNIIIFKAFLRLFLIFLFPFPYPENPGLHRPPGHGYG